MLTRTLTGVIGLALVIFIMALGSPYIEIAGLIIALIGVYEFYQMVGKKYKIMTWIGYISMLVYFIGFRFFTNHFLGFITLFLLALLVGMVFTHPKYGIADVSMTFVGPIYVGVMLSFILMTRLLPSGEFLVWLIFISAWGSDTCAYFAGRFFGKHKLAPVLSPKKTIEGSVGGAVGATLIDWLYTWIYQTFSPVVDKIGRASCSESEYD